MKNRQISILTAIIIVYMLMAFIWWAILLQRNNSSIYALNKELLELKSSGTEYSEEVAQLTQIHNRKNNMILGEGLVFGLTLAIGIYMISRAYGKEIEAARRQKNFLLSVTHELKSPLASINLILDTFKKRSLPEDKVKELAGDGLSESYRLEGLFDKILQATRLQSKHNYYFEEADLSVIVKGIVGKYKARYDTLSIDTDIEEDVKAEVDVESIGIIMHNLIENAIKYSEQERLVDIKLSESPQKVTISVGDQGMGIDEGEKRNIFDQFYRVGSEDTRKTKGTGLGLYIVKGIVDAHRGRIIIEDNKPRGSRFVITIPKKKA